MKILDWKQGNLVGLEVPMSGKIWVRSLIIIYNWLVRMYYIQMNNEYYWLIKHFDDTTLDHIRNRFDKESGEWRDGEIATDHVGLVGGAVIYINVSV